MDEYKYSLDDHLNLFYSYSQGKHQRESEPILENNVTRAFLIILKEIPDLAVSFITNNFKNINISKTNLHYDLQGLSDKELMDNIPIRILLGISPKEYSGNVKLSKQYKDIIRTIDDGGICKDLNSQINKKEYGESISNIILEKNFPFLINVEYDEKEVSNFIASICKSCVLDGWIIQKDNFAIAIENKIRGNLYEEQMIRHVRDKNGFNSSLNNVTIKYMLWAEIYNFLNNYQTTNEKEVFLIQEFQKYLMLARVLPPNISKSIKGLEPRDKIHRKNYLFDVCTSVCKTIKNEKNLSFSLNKHFIRNNEDYIGIDLYENEHGIPFSSIIHISISFNLNSNGINVLSVFIILGNAGKMKYLRDILNDEFVDVKKIIRSIYNTSKGEIHYSITEKWRTSRYLNLYIPTKRLVNDDFFKSSKNEFVEEINSIYDKKKEVLKLKAEGNKKELDNIIGESLNKLMDPQIKKEYNEHLDKFLDHVTSTLNPNFIFRIENEVIDVKDKLEEVIFKSINDLLPLYTFLRDKLKDSKTTKKESRKNKI